LRDVEEMLAVVRQAFDEEYRDLLLQIEQANENLESGAQFQGECNHRKKVLEPSTTDLQRLAKKLQHISTVWRDDKIPSIKRVSKLRSLVESFRPKTPLAALVDCDEVISPGGPSLDELLFEPAPRTAVSRPPSRQLECVDEM
jgi:hypothetical protein